ncbi:sigma-70 family RNA polymerase sigma factor [Virgisporangium ochraceum]|uniref:RNA polymerase sigma factor SigL n=1 Tax=Virgisporangium ochraceum TaxID=65505 RepID=A0A8J4EDW6_9ACTN|nr:sigma-70 family RNA polymerase sigma factor [Virgisporangium ochraceum]GIJ71111.1 RNA polymerase sigma factor SigL [Virgisporangium ochraceum]
MTVLAEHPVASDPLRTIHDRYRQGLHTYLVKLTFGDVGLAEDLVQETFLRAWRHATGRADLDADTALPWLYTVARRLVVDHLRARRARPPETFMDDLSGVPVVHDPIGMALAEQSLRDALRDLLPEHRDVLVRLYLHGRTPAQVAGRLGIPVGTVKSRSFYARRALRARLEG